MRETYRSPLFRCLVCLILVCCILVNLSPVRAEALPLSTWVWLEASMVFASLFAGLGVSPVDELADGFADACNDCWDFISLNYDFVTDDQKIAVWSTGTDELPFMIDQELVEAVREWLFTSETVVEDEAAAGMAYYNNRYLPVLVTPSFPSLLGDSYYAAITYWEEDGFRLWYGKNPFVSIESDIIGSSGGGFAEYHSMSNDAWVYKSKTSNFTSTYWGRIIWANHDIYDKDSGSIFLSASEPTDTVIISADDQQYLTNYIAPSSEDFTTGYSDWAAGAISVPGIRSKEEAEELVVPLSIPGTAADVYSFAQTDVWTGANTAADVIAQAVPITGTDTGDPSVPSVPDVPAEVAPYTFSLNDIFPFCIPFDLYDFLTCLDATPVAPVINWQIQLPGGSTYPLTVDLSAFDSVAELLRKLELLVFSIALALKTRDLIKG